jgi:hypothetical protein
MLALSAPSNNISSSGRRRLMADGGEKTFAAIFYGPHTPNTVGLI